MWLYGVGTLGRDMVYGFVTFYLMFYLTDVLSLSKQTIVAVTMIIMGLRIFDALNDPFAGILIDNTKGRFGKFKPWVFGGALCSMVFTVLLFTDFGLSGAAFLLVFGLVYLMWGISYTANDIGYWSMLPSLSQDQKRREKIGAVARIFANLGSFSIVAGLVPLSGYLSGLTGSLKSAYFWIAVMVAVAMLFFQLIMLLTVQSDPALRESRQATPIKELFSVIIANDQLLWITLSMVVFMIGYMTTISFGLYYFVYIYGDKNMYSVFALVLGLSQIIGLSVFPLLSKRLTRKQLYTFATATVAVGYAIFFIAERSIVLVALGGACIFFGQSFIQLLILMCFADTVEYGEYKSGRRNDSITFSLQPLISKAGGAIASGIVGLTIVYSGVKDAVGPQDLSSAGRLLFKTSMITLPLVLIIIGYIVYSKKFTIDEKRYAEIIEALNKRKREE